jgi:predicted HTH transcriptional regulator
MIRDNLEPEPPYTARMIDHEGKKVLAIEVTAASQPCSYRNGSRLEFYVRRGPNTVPARHHDIATGRQHRRSERQVTAAGDSPSAPVPPDRAAAR